MPWAESGSAQSSAVFLISPQEMLSLMPAECYGGGGSPALDRHWWKACVPGAGGQRLLSPLPVSCSVAQSCPTFATPWTTACQAPLSFIISWCLLKPMSIESVIAFNHLILCHPLFLLPSIVPSIRVFSNESALCVRWPKY